MVGHKEQGQEHWRHSLRGTDEWQWEDDNPAWKQMDVASQALQMLMSSWEAQPQLRSVCFLR